MKTHKEMITDKPTCWQVIGWNSAGCAPEDQATASSCYTGDNAFERARDAMVEFIREDGLEDCVDANVDLNDPELMCVTVDNGNRGYYLQQNMMIEA